MRITRKMFWPTAVAPKPITGRLLARLGGRLPGVIPSKPRRRKENHPGTSARSPAQPITRLALGRFALAALVTRLTELLRAAAAGFQRRERRAGIRTAGLPTGIASHLGHIFKLPNGGRTPW